MEEQQNSENLRGTLRGVGLIRKAMQSFGRVLSKRGHVGRCLKDRCGDELADGLAGERQGETGGEQPSLEGSTKAQMRKEAGLR